MNSTKQPAKGRNRHFGFDLDAMRPFSGPRISPG